MARFWQFAQLSDHFKTTPPISPIPLTKLLPPQPPSTPSSSLSSHHPKLYISGLPAFSQSTSPAILASLGITHILSVLDWNPADDFPGIFHGERGQGGVVTTPVVTESAGGRKAERERKWLWLRAEDVPEEDLLRYFPRACAFLEDGWRVAEGGVGDGGDGGEGVERGLLVHCAMGVSRSATVICAFMMWKLGIGVAEALEVIKEGRAVCRPNDGFVRQLEVWGEMLKEKSEERRLRIYERWKKGEAEKAKL